MEMDKQNKIFSQNLSRQIQLHDVSQVDIAEALGVSKTVVNNWVKGIAIPRINKVAELSEFFDVSIHALIDENYQPSKEEKLLKYFSTFSEADKDKLLERAEEIYQLAKLRG